MKTAATNKSQRPTIALLVDGLIEDYEVKVWAGVGDAAKKLDFNLLCFACGTLDSPHLFSSQRNILLDLVECATEAGHIDGILALSGALANFSTPERLLSTYARFRKIPIVSIGSQFKGIPSVTVNNAAGMHDMVSHLITHHGRRRIAFICGPEHSHDAQERLEAYKQSLQEAGIAFDPGLVAPGDFLIPSGERAVALFMDERKARFDALVGANDGMALDAMNALLARGVKIPEDVAIAGFDDAKEARSITPALASVRQPGKELGLRAVSLLHELMQGKKTSERNLLPTEPVYRESCGCIASRTDDTPAEALRRSRQEEQTLHLYRVYQKMMTSLKMETLREITDYAMPRLQIESFYISTYADPKTGPRGGMQPLIAFDSEQKDPATLAGFPAGQILPGGGLRQQDRRFSFAVYALFAEHDQIGYAAYDMSRNVNSSIYEALTGQLSGMLRASALLENLEAQVQQRTADLQRKTQEVERLNEELVRKNKIDTLTTLYNRGAFFEYMRVEINRMRRIYHKLQQQHSIDASFCIMMVDIDHFKNINDTYGHLVGDRVLKHIGEMLNSKSVFRKEDVAGRFGGEEFIIVLTNTSVEKALLPAQRLADALARADFDAEDRRKFKVTVSIGISQYYPEDKTDEAVINRADKALYHAKDTGRNKIVIYEEAFPAKAE